ncbi:hypothetical protein CBS101457_005341 [Exobasidium rhododendri]|nr:hypothetical protein CBS101457_005341 [Exobasidium rhododendri]
MEAAQEDDRLSLVSPVGYSASSCGYCTPSGSGQRSKGKSSKSYGIWANNITPETYQQLLDRGWRRSGHYIYRPDCSYQGTCCAQVAIRVPVETYRPRNDQKKAISALQRLVRQPEGDPSSTVVPVMGSRKGKFSRRWDAEREWKLIEWGEEEEYRWDMDEIREESSDLLLARKKIMKSIHQARSRKAQEERKWKGDEKGQSSLTSLRGPKKRRFETKLRVAESTMEKYEMFRSYQMRVHGESETKVSSKEGFERFLCEGPLMPFLPDTTASLKEEDVKSTPGQAVDVATDTPIAYNLYHMEYRYQGRLVAVGVLDILPRSISSVYLFYDPDYSHLKLGKVSAIREIVLVKQIGRKRGMEGVQYYNIGLYIHTCPKMRYKAEYQPCELLDPLTCSWLPFRVIQGALDRGVRYDFLEHRGEQLVPQRRAKSAVSKRESGAEEEGDDEEEGEEEDDEDDGNLPVPPPPGMLDPTKLPPTTIAHCLIFDHGRVDVLLRTKMMKEPTKLLKITECLAALGPLCNRFCLYL